jgi:hypothetical protein
MPMVMLLSPATQIRRHENFLRLAKRYIIPTPPTPATERLRLAFDVESDGLLDAATKIHCICIGNLDSGHISEFGPDQIEAALARLSETDYLIGHNCDGFDLPLLERLHGWAPKPSCKVVDTLIASRLILANIDSLDDEAAARGDPKLGKLRGRHSLEAWGIRLGLAKIGAELEDFSLWSPELQQRCVGDVHLTMALWRFLQPDGQPTQALELEHRVAEVCAAITEAGIPFDRAAGEALARSWTEQITPLRAQLIEQFPGLENPNSRSQVGKLLEARGWVPAARTKKTKQPKLDAEAMENIAQQFPELTGLSEFFIFSLRLGQLVNGDKAWLKHIDDDGRIHGSLVHIGTPHHRAAHHDPNLAQVPNPKKGKPLAGECRALFHIDDNSDWTFVTCDQAGLQDRAFAHYLAEFDGGAYARAFASGNFDPHWTMVRALELVPDETKRDKGNKLHTALREGCKSFRYAFLFGAQEERLGIVTLATIRSAVAVDPVAGGALLRRFFPKTDVARLRSIGSKALNDFMKATPGLRELRNSLEQQATKAGWLPGLDGRRIPTNASRTVLNYAVTSAEAIICKRWLVDVYDELHARFRYGWQGDVVLVAWTHDELAACCRREIAEQVGEVMLHHAKAAGEHFGFKVPLSGDLTIGKSWGGASEKTTAPVNATETAAPAAAAAPELMPESFNTRKITGSLRCCAHCQQPVSADAVSNHGDGWLHPGCVEPFLRRRMAEEGIPWEVPQSGDSRSPWATPAIVELHDAKPRQIDPIKPKSDVGIPISGSLNQYPVHDSQCAGCRPASFVIFPDLPMTPIAAAISLAAQGIRSFPAPPNTKKSFKSEKFSGAVWGMTKDPKEIRRDYARWPDAQIGLPTGAVNGIFVVEADTAQGHNVDGIANLAQLEAEHGKLPPTPMARSPSGSLHHYFRHPGHDIEIRNSSSKIAPGVDVRGDGGMVIAPPSHRHDDGQYRWIRGGEIAPAPNWLLELIFAHQPAEPADAAGDCFAESAYVAGDGFDEPDPPESLEKIKAALAVLDPRTLGHDGHLKVACALFSELGNKGFDLLTAWLQIYPDYHDPALAKEQWRSIARKNGYAYTIGSLYYLADLADESDYGWRTKFDGDDSAMFVRSNGSGSMPNGPGAGGCAESIAPATNGGDGKAQSSAQTVNIDTWPVLAPEAHYGLAGDVVAALAPHTEADPVALLIQYLLSFGNCAGRTAYALAENTKHFANLFAVLVGATAKARKGTAAERIRRIFEKVDPDWSALRTQGGMSSGEGVIHAVRDPTFGMKKGIEELTDSGITDKRLLLDEREFYQALAVMRREASILSRVIRDAWDGREVLATLTKHSPTRATGAHISIIGHITTDELREALDHTSMINGYANRFLFVCVRRSRLLPFGGANIELDGIAERTREALTTAQTIGLVTFSDRARQLWASEYERLTENRPGLFGAITARADPQTLRLALIYALLDGSSQIRRRHLRAALAVWNFCDASAKYIFGTDILGNPVADTIMRALRNVGSTGLSRTQIRDLFGRNADAGKITDALTRLLTTGKARRGTSRVPDRRAGVRSKCGLQSRRRAMQLEAKLRHALRDAGPAGLSRTAIRNLFHRNIDGDEITTALRRLHIAGEAYPQTMLSGPRGGRPVQRWFVPPGFGHSVIDAVVE